MDIHDSSAPVSAIDAAQDIINRHAAGMCDRCKRWKPLLLRRQLMRVCTECSGWVPAETTEPPTGPMD